jgi:hypothetical protein
MNSAPVFTSPSTAKSLWQEYRIYEDRLEFETIFGTMVVDFENVETIKIAESDVKDLFHGDLHLNNFRPALKFDWANFVKHVVLDKSTGHVRRVLFTPEDPEAFKTALEESFSRFRQSKSVE